MKGGAERRCADRSLDASEALRLPGVADVITADDIPGQKVRKVFTYEEELLAQSQVGSDPLSHPGRETAPLSCPGVLRWPDVVRCGR